jgi:hypothetical protein
LTLIVGRDEDEWLLVAFRYGAGELVPTQLRVSDRDDGDLLVSLDVSRHTKRHRRLPSALGDADRAH